MKQEGKIFFCVKSEVLFQVDKTELRAGIISVEYILLFLRKEKLDLCNKSGNHVETYVTYKTTKDRRFLHKTKVFQTTHVMSIDNLVTWSIPFLRW